MPDMRIKSAPVGCSTRRQLGCLLAAHAMSAPSALLFFTCFAVSACQATTATRPPATITLDAADGTTTTMTSASIASYGAAIAEKIRRSWSRPAGTPKTFNCTIRIEQSVIGEVQSVGMHKSCGVPELDESLLAAAWKASPLPLPTDTSIPYQQVVYARFCPGPSSESCGF